MSAQNSDHIQQQLIDARRSQILEAAVKVFAEKGFHKATIKEVAREAGVADGTIYNYFANKNGLILGLLDLVNETDERESHFLLSHDMDIHTFFRIYIHQRFAYLNPSGYSLFQALIPELLTNKELCDLYYQRIIEPTFQKTEPFFQGWIDRGVLKPFDIRLTLSAISGMFLGMIMLRFLGDQYLIDQWDKLPDLMTNMILNGITK